MTKPSRLQEPCYARASDDMQYNYELFEALAAAYPVQRLEHCLRPATLEREFQVVLRGGRALTTRVPMGADVLAVTQKIVQGFGMQQSHTNSLIEEPSNGQED
jgi:hypothetical protein